MRLRFIREILVAMLTTIAVAGCTSQAVKPRSDLRIAGPAGMLAIDDGGTGGLPVVFVHSYAGSKSHWKAQLAHLRPSRRAVGFDLRGHGESSPPANNVYASEALAADIAAVVDALGLKRFVLVGHSLGGAAAIAYAGAHPQRVAGLVLVGAPGKTPPDQAAKIVASLRANYDKVMQDFWNELLVDARPEVRAQLLRERGTIGKEASLSIIEGLFAEDPLPALKRYPGPVLIVVTTHEDHPSDLHRLMPTLPNRLIAGTSHWPHLDRPDEFNRVLDAFLASVRENGTQA
jgi:pimeloyl-ACP methyl ester carboxylesterase